MDTRIRRFFVALGPGILVAATGVGAGDMLTAGLGGSAVGVAIAWAALLGAVLKYVLTEGIARWQMATETTLLEGWVSRLGSWIQWLFLAYLLAWTFFTGGALMGACGVAATGLLPLTSDLHVSKIIWGIVHAAAGLMLVRLGGFRWFERLMSVCVAVMFVSVVVTAAMAQVDAAAVLRGALLPTIPENGAGWVLGLLGGVGGTVTLLSYGYWVREVSRDGMAGLRTCRIDLGVAYALTAAFGVAMVVIGSSVTLEGRGAGVAPLLAAQLGERIGPLGYWIFLVGFWGAVFSSLLGVWQGVPYLFADFLALRRRKKGDVGAGMPLAETRGYKVYLFAMAVVPLPLLWVSVKKAQLAYAVFGALFMPLLAFTLLLMNNRVAWVGSRYRNGPVTNLILLATLVLFAYLGIRQFGASVQGLGIR